MAKPRKKSEPRPLRSSLRSSLERYMKRALVEDDKFVHQLCTGALESFDDEEKRLRIAALREEADALEGGS